MPRSFDDDVWIDANGCPTERVWLGGQEVIVHYDDITEQDKTTVRGIPVTTPLRTVIDLAPDIDAAHLHEMVHDFLARGLFTVEQARARLAEPDMVHRRGAELLRKVLPH